MKQLLFVLLIGLMFSACSEKKASDSVQKGEIVKVNLKIEGMTCENCEKTICKCAESMEGTLEASASYKTGTADIKFNQSKTSIEDIKVEIEKKGYKVVDFAVVKDQN